MITYSTISRINRDKRIIRRLLGNHFCYSYKFLFLFFIIIIINCSIGFFLIGRTKWKSYIARCIDLWRSWLLRDLVGGSYIYIRSFLDNLQIPNAKTIFHGRFKSKIGLELVRLWCNQSVNGFSPVSCSMGLSKSFAWVYDEYTMLYHNHLDLKISNLFFRTYDKL